VFSWYYNGLYKFSGYASSFFTSFYFIRMIFKPGVEFHPAVQEGGSMDPLFPQSMILICSSGRLLLCRSLV